MEDQHFLKKKIKKYQNSPAPLPQEKTYLP